MRRGSAGGERSAGAPVEFCLHTPPPPPSRHAEHDSDSDSDLSLEEDPSGSYGSTHSSDSEDEPGGTAWDALLRPEQPPTPTGNGRSGGLRGVGRGGGGRGAPRLSAPTSCR